MSPTGVKASSLNATSTGLQIEGSGAAFYWWGGGVLVFRLVCCLVFVLFPLLPNPRVVIIFYFIDFVS